MTTWGALEIYGPIPRGFVSVIWHEAQAARLHKNSPGDSKVQPGLEAWLALITGGSS